MKRFLATILIVICAISSCKKDKDKAPPTAPLVQTAAITNNGGGNITTGGSIVSDGGASITQSGVVWSKTNATPALTDSMVASAATTGAFTVNINGIDFGQTYYFRAFATNSVGTGYGDVVTLTTSSDSVRFTYNGQSVTYGIITSPVTGKKWLDRNLGAEQVATAYDDYKAYGDLFQWGRPDDGHQVITWTASDAGTPVNGTVGGSAGTTATSDVPGHNNFIIPPYDYPLDWRSDNNRGRWVTAPQGPCPAGWHVPSETEWLAEVSNTSGGTASSGGFTERITAYNQLKLTTAGTRNVDGPGVVLFLQAGRFGHYWTTSDEFSPDGFFGAKYLLVGEFSSRGWLDFKSTAKSVRCIKD